MKKLCFIVLGVLGLINSSHAALNDVGGGLVNDSTLNVTWMKDANLFKTLCDATDPIATGFVPVDAANSAAICANNGRMTWNDAQAWIAHLNAQNYLGHIDWRQPLTLQPDATCERQTVAGGFPDQGEGYNCRGSELGHLYNISLGNPNHVGTGATGGTVGTGCFPGCFQNTAPFEHAQSSAYWSGDSYAPDPARAWFFNADFGTQVDISKGLENVFVWPVRSGQSVVVPLAAQNIPTVSVWGLGLMIVLLGWVAQRRSNIG